MDSAFKRRAESDIQGLDSTELVQVSLDGRGILPLILAMEIQDVLVRGRRVAMAYDIAVAADAKQGFCRIMNHDLITEQRSSAGGIN